MPNDGTRNPFPRIARFQTGFMPALAQIVFIRMNNQTSTNNVGFGAMQRNHFIYYLHLACTLAIRDQIP
jgi:hypothetical protein